MPYARHPAASAATTTHVSRYVPRAALGMGGLGAIIGGTAAAAKNIRRVQQAEINREEAVKDTIKEAAGAGLATMTATAVVGAVGATGLLALLGIVTLATGTKYLWDSVGAASPTLQSAKAVKAKTAKLEEPKKQEPAKA